MHQKAKTTTRKKFVLWGTAALASMSVLKYFTNRKNKQPEKIKMLTQDGKLVEVDASLIKKTGNKITNTTIHDWITPNQNS
jgi:ABC-type metal ion transport system substrate-binding protein